MKPMLSATLEDLSQVRYPVMVSAKLDGIRCLIQDGMAVSRNLKPIPNRTVQRFLSGLPNGLDGELIVGPPTGGDVWNRSNSGVMKEDGDPAFRYYVFDYLAADNCIQGFSERLFNAFGLVANYSSDRVVVLKHIPCANEVELREAEERVVNAGYEGLMLRDPHGRYKFGRSTLREGGLMKLKRWFDTEATVDGFVERQHNGNTATVDALGRTKRSMHKANMTGRGDLGAIVCTLNGVTFEIGTGFTDDQRASIWARRDEYIGRPVTFKYQNLTPAGVPRFPVFLRWPEAGR